MKRRELVRTRVLSRRRPCARPNLGADVGELDLGALAGPSVELGSETDRVPRAVRTHAQRECGESVCSQLATDLPRPRPASRSHGHPFVRLQATDRNQITLVEPARRPRRAGLATAIARPLGQSFADRLWIESQARPGPAAEADDPELIGVLVHPGARDAQLFGDFAHREQVAAALASRSNELRDPARDRLDRRRVQADRVSSSRLLWLMLVHAAIRCRAAEPPGWLADGSNEAPCLLLNPSSVASAQTNFRIEPERRVLNSRSIRRSRASHRAECEVAADAETSTDSTWRRSPTFSSTPI